MMTTTIRAAGLAALLLAAGAAAAAEQPDCAAPQTQAEMTACAHLDYEAADAELNRLWPDVVADAKARDADLGDLPKSLGVPTTLAALRAAQRAWIAYRDAECEFESYQAFGGTMQPMLGSQCLARLTRERTAFLKELLEGLD